MLTAIKGLLRDRRDRREMLNMRTMLVELQKLLFPENEMTGALVRNKTGLHLTQHLESRLGIMGPDFITTVSTDLELGQEGELLDRLPPERLDQLAAELGRLAGRTLLERGNPEEWDEDSGEPTVNVAHLIALRLLSGWLKTKSIVHTSTNRAVVKEAQDTRTFTLLILKDCYAFFVVKRRYRKATNEEWLAVGAAARRQQGNRTRPAHTR